MKLWLDAEVHSGYDEDSRWWVRQIDWPDSLRLPVAGDGFPLLQPEGDESIDAATRVAEVGFRVELDLNRTTAQVKPRVRIVSSIGGFRTYELERLGFVVATVETDAQAGEGENCASAARMIEDFS